MEAYITPENIANIILFVMPGYFALQTYALVYSKPSGEFSHIFLKSVVYSLPIVSAYTLLRRGISDSPPPVASIWYVLPLLILSVALGWLASYLRRAKILHRVVHKLHLPEADEDFLRLQFSKLSKNEQVTVALKSGEVFLGMPRAGSTMRDGSDRQYSFILIAWFNKEKNAWEESAGTVIVTLGDVLYFQTESPLD